MDKILSALIRVFRVSVCCIVAAGVLYFIKTPYAFVIVPILSGFGKLLRDKWGLNWLPF